MGSKTLAGYLTVLSITHEYLDTSPAEIPLLHHAVTSFTQSPNVLKKYPLEKEIIAESELYELLSTAKRGNIANDAKIRLYVMQLRLELIMSEFTLASGTISRLKDLFAALGIQEEIGPLVQVILLRSELLEVEAYLNPDTVVLEEQSNAKSNSNSQSKSTAKVISPLDRLANIKHIVNNYIDSSSKVVIEALNRNAALSVTSSGLQAMRSSADLYNLEKRKRALDKNIANLAVKVQLETKDQSTTNAKLNPILAVNESITALNELLLLRPLDAEVHMELANIYLRSGRFKEALWHVGETLMVGCGSAWNVWSLRGELCLLQSDCEMEGQNETGKRAKAWLSAAIASFMYSIELCDDYVRSWCGIHVCLTKLAKLEGELDPVYQSVITLKNEKMKTLLNDECVSKKDRENLSWILNNYRMETE
jgi:hypothetical protein